MANALVKKQNVAIGEFRDAIEDLSGICVACWVARRKRIRHDTFTCSLTQVCNVRTPWGENEVIFKRWRDNLRKEFPGGCLCYRCGIPYHKELHSSQNSGCGKDDIVYPLIYAAFGAYRDVIMNRNIGQEIRYTALGVSAGKARRSSGKGPIKKGENKKTDDELMLRFLRGSIRGYDKWLKLHDVFLYFYKWIKDEEGLAGEVEEDNDQEHYQLSSQESM